MKKIILLIVSVWMCVSCGNLEEMNIDPDNATQTHPKLLLTQICMNAFKRGTDGMYATKKVIQADGESADQYYKWTRGSFGYYDNLRNVQKMGEEAERVNAPVYTALTKFFRAYYFYELTLRFGDIPYSQALKGEKEEIYTPEYDAQEDVFAGILQELREADEILANDASVIDGDIIYNGNSTQWRKLINSFRLKVLMTLSNHTTVGNINIASEFKNIATNSPLMNSLADNGQLVYLDQQGNRYPQFNAQWSGYYMIHLSNVCAHVGTHACSSSAHRPTKERLKENLSTTSALTKEETLPPLIAMLLSKLVRVPYRPSTTVSVQIRL